MNNIKTKMMQVIDFLGCETPQTWLDAAQDNLPLLLVDHAHCEKKAASTALSFIFRYPNQVQLLKPMSRFAREELRHFEKVLALMHKAGVPFAHLPPARYAKGMRRHMKTSEPHKLIDSLIVGAFIEARSCERFAKLVPFLTGEMQKFYSGLLAAEANHFQVYLKLARETADFNIDDRIEMFKHVEADLIMQPDNEFRFHSGVPEAEAAN